MRHFLALLAALLTLEPALAQTQPNVTPKATAWIDDNIEVDIRLKGAPTALNPAPTVRLISAVKFAQPNANIYNFTHPCWNKTAACAPVQGLAFQVFIRLPGGIRHNITSDTGLCGDKASECITPWFAPITAKPGEGYYFRYSRARATWDATPSIVTLLPDLIVTSLSYSSATGIFTSFVRNQGLAATPAGVHIGVAYSVDGVYRTWGMFPGPLAAGATVGIGSEGGTYAIPPGTHTISAWVDDAQRFTEVDETNNGLSEQITVAF